MDLNCDYGNIITVDFFRNQLHEFKLWRKINKYNITEITEKYKERKYVLYDLEADIENGIIFFGDVHDFLLTDLTYTLIAIPLESIMMISHVMNKDKPYQAIITHESGKIIIEANLTESQI